MNARTDADYRRATERLTAHAQRDLERLFNRINLDHPLGTRNVLTDAIPRLVARYGNAVAQVARDWYDAVRLIEEVPGGYEAALAEGIAPEFIEARIRYGAGHLFGSEPGAMLAFLQSAVQKYIADYGRNTVIHNVRRDPYAVGWQRVTSAGACGLCLMLAGRGGVYKQTTVRFAAHDDCNCSVRPSWDPNAKEVPVEAYRASARTSAMSEAERSVHNAFLRDYIKRHELE